MACMASNLEQADRLLSLMSPLGTILRKHNTWELKIRFSINLQSKMSIFEPKEGKFPMGPHGGKLWSLAPSLSVV
jgi:hypothetical protein